MEWTLLIYKDRHRFARDEVVLNVWEIVTMSTATSKQLKRTMLGGLIATLLCANGVAGAATEVEPNDSAAQAQVQVIPVDGISITGRIGTAAGELTTDLDVFAFQAKAGDVPSIMVVSDGAWDTLVGLYDSAGNLLEMNDDAYPMNPGSTSPYDSRIDTYRIAADDTYYVAVTPIPRYLGANVSVINPSAAMGGAYTLLVEGVTPPPAPEPDPEPTPTPDPTPEPPPSSGGSEPFVVTMEVKHWHGGDPSMGRYKGKDPIPVAIMSAPGFDAVAMVNRQSLTFGATGTERSLIRCMNKGRDVRVEGVRDGEKDLVCFFRPDVAGFKTGDVQAFLKGNLVNGGKIEASAALKVFEVSAKKKEGWHKRHNIDPRSKKYKKRDHRDKKGDRNRSKRKDH